MQSDKFPVETMNSMEAHIAHLRVAMKKYTLQELVQVQDKWRNESVPEEYQKLLKDELKFRDGEIKVKRVADLGSGEGV